MIVWYLLHLNCFYCRTDRRLQRTSRFLWKMEFVFWSGKSQKTMVEPPLNTTRSKMYLILCYLKKSNFLFFRLLKKNHSEHFHKTKTKQWYISIRLFNFIFYLFPFYFHQNDNIIFILYTNFRHIYNEIICILFVSLKLSDWKIRIRKGVLDGLRQEPRQHVRGERSFVRPRVSVQGLGRQRVRRLRRDRGAEQSLH